MSKKDTKSDNQTEDVIEPDELIEDVDTKNLDEPTRELLEQQITELNDDLKRAQADFMNLKRRTAEAHASQATRVKADIVRKLLPVLDSLERAIDHKPDSLSDNDWAKGIDAVVKQMRKTLGDYGVTKIDAVGEEFDPNLHEAIAIDDSTKGRKEVVAEELQTGYKLNDVVIRHAMVKVERQ